MKVTIKRFTKSALIGYAISRMRRLEESHGFSEKNGWAQVEGKGEAINRLYGEYACLARLIEDAANGDIT